MDRMNRRQFLRNTARFGSLTLVVPGLFRPAAGQRINGDDPLRVGYLAVSVQTGPRASATLGAELGAAEVQRAAELFGRRFELLRSTAASSSTLGDRRCGRTLGALGRRGGVRLGRTNCFM